MRRWVFVGGDKHLTPGDRQVLRAWVGNDRDCYQIADTGDVHLLLYEYDRVSLIALLHMLHVYDPI